MSKRNGSKQAQTGPDILQPTARDTYELFGAVQERYKGLIELNIRVKGLSLIVPDAYKDDAKKIAMMAERWNLGDFRNTRSEEMALRSFAQFTCDVNAKLRNQKKVALEWRD